MNSMAYEVTLRFYHSLEIEASLFQVFLYLKSFFPLTNIHVAVFNKEEGTIHYMASATKEGGVLIDEKVKLSEKAAKEGRFLVPGTVFMLDRAHDSRIIRESLVAQPDVPAKPGGFKPEDDFSSMTMAMDVGPPLIGLCTIAGLGKQQYTDKLKQQFLNLFRPINSALLNLLQHRDIQERNHRLVSENKSLHLRYGHPDHHRIIGNEQGLKSAMSKARKVAKTSVPVLITGETGTGKEVIAQAIHQMSLQQDGPIICVNCGAIPSSLVESELFGHEKGAFTGAVNQKRGYFEQADGGTLFLDEIGDLPLTMQVKFLRVIQEKTLCRVGGHEPVLVNTRVITATHNDLEEMIREKQFRQDLWYRLSVFPIHLPALRERIADIPELVHYFLGKKQAQMHLAIRPQLAKGAMDRLLHYHWPGNIRELENIIERNLIISDGKALTFQELSQADSLELLDNGNNHIIEALDDMIITHIRKALAVTKGRVAGKGGAAELLGLNKSTMWGKMRKYGIKGEL